MSAKIKTLSTPYIILEIALLIEKPPPFVIDRILVIDCQQEQQITRAIQRDHVSAEMAQQIIAAQIEPQLRLAKSHDIIENNGSFESLQQEINKLHGKYLMMASQYTNNH
jgi:dephospho-CoA kinase